MKPLQHVASGYNLRLDLSVGSVISLAAITCLHYQTVTLLCVAVTGHQLFQRPVDVTVASAVIHCLFHFSLAVVLLYQAN